MTPKIPVHNPGAMPMYVAGLMIPPDETRHFDADLVPLHLRPAAPEPEAAPAPDPLAVLLAHSVKDIKALLPELDDATLEALGSAEQAAETPRSTLLGAIAEEQLTRAEAAEAAKAGAGADADPAAGDGAD